MHFSDVIVVGLGAVGSATAYQLALRGQSVRGFDRFTPPHSYGSSHGDSRITRNAIGEGGAYVPFVSRSHELWRQLEADTGLDIFNSCGMLMMKKASVSAAQHGVKDRFAATVAIAEELGIPHELLYGSDIEQQFPQLNLGGEDYKGYFEPHSGFVNPENAVRAQLDLAGRQGAQLHYDEAVKSIDESNGTTTVITDKGTYQCAKLVISAGAWAGELLGGGPSSDQLKVYRQTMHWLSVDPSEAEKFVPGRFPALICTFGNGPSDYFYAFPSTDGGQSVKVASETYEMTTTAGELDRTVSAGEQRAVFDRCISGRVRGLTLPAHRSAACMYTVTPDYKFIIDRLHASSSTWLASPCSGHGFKHSAAVGETLAELIVSGSSTIDVAAFSLSRESLDLS